MGRDGGRMAGSPARTGWHADPDRRLRGLHQGLVVGARGHVADDGRVHDVLFRMYGVYNVVFGLMASAIAVTAFRRGERWAWWALLVGNTIAFGVGDDVRPDRERDRAVRAVGVPRPRPRLRGTRGHRSIPVSRTANPINGVAPRAIRAKEEEDDGLLRATTLNAARRRCRSRRRVLFACHGVSGPASFAPRDSTTSSRRSRTCPRARVRTRPRSTWSSSRRVRGRCKESRCR